MPQNVYIKLKIIQQSFDQSIGSKNIRKRELNTKNKLKKSERIVI